MTARCRCRRADAALRAVVNFDAFEGVTGWYIGYDGPGCVTLASDASQRERGHRAMGRVDSATRGSVVCT